MRNNTRVGGKWALRAVTILFAALFIAASVTTVYAANNPLTFTVRQTFDTISLEVNSTFTYRMMPVDPSNPMPPGSSSVTGYNFSITGNDSASIGPITYPVVPAVYRYEIYQVVPMEVPGYVYDERIFILEVHVLVNPSTDETDVKYVIFNKDGTKADEIVFNNTYGYTPTDPNLMPDYSVVKTVTGNPPTSSTFTFKLTAQNATQPMPAGSVNGVKTVTITGTGTASFGKWTYTQPGTYYYTVTEVIPSPPVAEYTYDTAVYTITDNVADINGQLVLTRIVTNATNGVVTSFTFINNYSYPGGPTPPPGPGTGDRMNPSAYATIFSISSALAVGAAIYLIFGGKKNKSYYRRYEKR